MLVNGLTPYGKFYGWDNDILSRAILKGEFWEEYFRPWLDIIPLRRSVVDVGAHIGFFTVYMGRMGYDVYAFEPNPEVFKVLRMNVEANELQNRVTLYNGALYDREDVELHVCLRWTHFPKTPDGRVDMNEKVNSGNFTLVDGDIEKVEDGYLFSSKMVDSFGFTDVSLLKIDTEGCDLSVLKGARQTIQRCRPIIFFEVVPCLLYLRGNTLRDYEAFVEEMGYRLTMVHSSEGYKDYVAEPV